ncbi:pickpocket protein 28-like [Pectinophora gossypiella]|uniref:pickpocket protein 28-like n=1 Tax=Pectinophora gossypiella TaxID=13191 RepID=UPI00214E5557|nr:pickpocket protein 28-like [Pectinophora gossypiella]
MSYPNTEGIRPRKNPADTFRKQNYWNTQVKPDPPPWYVWDHKLPMTRSRSESNMMGVKSQTIPIYTTEEFRKDLREYLMTSTLHGLRYIGEKKLTWFERFFWLTAFCCSLVCAAFFILNIYNKWRLSPMIVSVNPENIPLTSLPFPAITICNVNQAKKTVAERYKHFGDLVDIKLLESLCVDEDQAADIFEDDVAGSADWDHTRQFLINVTQPCNEMLLDCTWNSKSMSCQDLFNAQLTDEGLCCTFNAVHRDYMFRDPKNINDMNITFPSPSVDWTPEGGYPPDSPPDGFPWRPKGVGTHHGLSLVVDANVAEYYCASTKSAGFKILLHNPTETPKIANLGEIYGAGIEARVAIQPRILDAQSALNTIDIRKRLCWFSSEKTLAFFRTYTMRNCEMECEAKQMLELCECVLYYMPKNRTTRVCGKADAKCYSSVWKNTSLAQDRLCEDCMPSCSELSYTERISSAALSERLVEQLAKQLNHRTADYFKKNMLVVHFYFEDGKFQRFTKGEIFGLTEFLSNTGGLLGLCMGFSVMSAVELLYFCTLRALCLASRRRPRPFTK